jgi:hypothetical protein
MKMITRAFLKTSDNILEDKPARIEDKLLIVNVDGKEFAWHIVTKAMIMNKPRKIFGRVHIPLTGSNPVAYFLIDLKCAHTLQIKEYQLVDGNSGDSLMANMTPDTLKSVLDYAFLKALAQKAAQGMMIMFLIAGVIGGFGLGYIGHEVVDSQTGTPTTTIMPSVTTPTTVVTNPTGGTIVTPTGPGA